MSSNQESASRWLSKRLAEAKSAYISASVLTVLSAACFVFFGWYVAEFAASWLVEGRILPEQLIVALVFLAGRYALAYFASITNYNAGKQVVARIKKMLYPRLLHNNRIDSVTGTLLVTRVSDDLKPFYSFFMPYAIASVLVSSLLLVISFWFEMWVGLVLLISLLIIPMQMIIIGIGAEHLHKKHIDLFVRYSEVFFNRLNTIAEIVNLNNLKPQYRFLEEKSKALNHATTQVMQVAILSSAVLELFVSISIAAIAVYTGMSLLGFMAGPNYGKGYDFQIALFLLILAPYFFFYLRKFVSAYHDRNKAMASAKLLMPILNEEVLAGPFDADEKLQYIEIKELNFAYPGTMVKVLHTIQLKLPAKGLVLIKGISGSGKSTLLKILSGKLRVEEGTVSVNGHDTLWSEQWLGVNSSYMNQFPFIFDGSLRYNVFLDKESEVYPAFMDKLLLKKEQAWDTPLSHNGKQLSGGEKQLVTMARMMLHPRPVAILDEPTANLDAATVAIILEQIELLASDRLVIVASHEDRFDAIASTTLSLNWGEQMKDE
jgi:ATP-binding cassette subfamily C protein CydD